MENSPDGRMQLEAQFLLIAALLQGFKTMLSAAPAHRAAVHKSMKDWIDISMLNAQASDEAIALARTMIDAAFPAAPLSGHEN